MIWVPEFEVHCFRIMPRRGDAVRIVLSYPTDLRMSNGEIYQGGIYSQSSDISATISGGPTVLDLGSVYDIDTITRDEMNSGQWDGAEVHSFFTSWFAPEEDDKPDKVYKLGKVRESDDRYTIEIMSQIDLLNQSTGLIMKPICSNILGDQHVDGAIIATDKSTCKVGAGLVSNIPSTVVSLTGPNSFFGSGLDSFPDDWFGNGELIFTSGPNANSPYRTITQFDSGGNITISEPFPGYSPVQPGHDFLIRAGCRKRFNQDCITKFNNAIHFRGYPHAPQKSSVIKFGDQ